MTTELEAVLTGGRNTFAQWENGDASEAQVAGALWALIDALSTPPADDVRVVSADVVLAALAHVYDGLADRASLPAVRMSNAKLRLRRLTDQIDQQAFEVRPRGTVTAPADEVREAVGDGIDYEPEKTCELCLRDDVYEEGQPFDDNGVWRHLSGGAVICDRCGMAAADAAKAAKGEVRQRGTVTESVTARDCGCACHIMPGVTHIAACCAVPPFDIARGVRS